MQTTRRALLATLPPFATGCLGKSQSNTPPATERPDSDDDGVPDSVDDYPTDDRRAYLSSSTVGTVELNAGEFSAIALTNSPQASGHVLYYEISVEGDTAVDCLVFEREAYDAYEDGARGVPFVSEYSRTGVTNTTLTKTLVDGEYIFALDYTDQATVPDTQAVSVDRRLEMAKPPE